MTEFEEFEQMLNKVAEGIPAELYTELNGGINLRRESKPHPKSAGDDLFILGEYCNYHDLGRFINIYYGSFCQIYRGYTKEQMREKIKSVLKHEFLHHVESLAGEKELELQDALSIEEYITATLGKSNFKERKDLEP